MEQTNATKIPGVLLALDLNKEKNSSNVAGSLGQQKGQTFRFEMG